MGANHVRVFDGMPTADLVEVVEPDPDIADSIRESYDVEVVNEASQIERAEAATIATPNATHLPIARTCLESGLDILVEKPLAAEPGDARAIADLADEHDRILQVGHIERFNPAVQVLQEILKNQETIALEAHRLGPFNEHLTEESVVFDLMIHDVDVIRTLVDEPIKHVDAVGTQSRSKEIDHAVAHLKFDGGILGTATSSHVTHSKVRQLTVTARDVFIELDYQEQDITLSRRESEETTVLEGTAGYRTETVQETPFIRTREPLKNELEHFIDCVEANNQPLVDAADGVAAVELASDIVEAVKSN